MGPIVLVQVGTYGRPNCPVMKKDGDLDWKEGKAEPDNAQQYFLTKLRRIATRGVKHLEVMEKRLAKGEELVRWYKSFRKIKTQEVLAKRFSTSNWERSRWIKS